MNQHLTSHKSNPNTQPCMNTHIQTIAWKARCVSRTLENQPVIHNPITLPLHSWTTRGFTRHKTQITLRLATTNSHQGVNEALNSMLCYSFVLSCCTCAFMRDSVRKVKHILSEILKKKSIYTQLWKNTNKKKKYTPLRRLVKKWSTLNNLSMQMRNRKNNMNKNINLHLNCINHIK